MRRIRIKVAVQVAVAVMCLASAAYITWHNRGGQSAASGAMGITPQPIAAPVAAVRKPPRAPLPGEPRVALLPIVVDRDVEEAAALQAAVHALVSDAAGTRWVERADVDAAVQELALDAVAGDASEALRLGRWLTADLAVRLRITEEDGAGRTLRVEVLDLAHADVLAQRELVLRDGVTIAEHAEPAAELVHQALSEARSRLHAAADAAVVAPLFFRNVSTTERLDPLEVRLLDSLSQAGGATGVRVLRFPAAAEGREEAELALLGMAEADADAWMSVADLYVWGSFRELEAPAGQTVATEDVEVEIDVQAWDGSTPIESRTYRATIGTLEDACRSAAKDVVVLASRPRAQIVDPRMRQQVLAQLATQRTRAATPVRERSSLDRDSPTTPWGLAVHAYQVHLAEVACFLDPSSVQTWAPLCRLRSLGTRIDDEHEYARHMDYLQLRKRVVRLFGTSAIREFDSEQLVRTLKGFTPGWGGLRGAPVTVDSPRARALRLEIAQAILAYASPTAERELPARIACDLMYAVFDTAVPLHTKVAAIDAFWPSIKPSWTRHVRGGGSRPFMSNRSSDDAIEDRIYAVLDAAGQSGRVEQLFMLEPKTAKEAEGRSPHPGPPAPPQPYSPRLDLVAKPDRPAATAEVASDRAPDAAGEDDVAAQIAALRVAGLSPRALPEPMAGSYADPAQVDRERRAHRIDLHGHGLAWKVWLMPAGARPPNAGYAFRPVAVDAVVEQVSGLGAPAPAELAGLTATTGATLRGDELWLATQAEGVVLYDVRTGQTRRFSTEAGLISRSMDGFVRGQGPLLVYRLGDDTVSRWDPTNERFLDVRLPVPVANEHSLALVGEWLMLGDNQPRLLHLVTGEIREFEAVRRAEAKQAERQAAERQRRIARMPPEVQQLLSQRPAAPAAGLRAAPVGPAELPPYAAADDSLWLVAADRLVRIRPAQGQTEDWPLPCLAPFAPVPDGHLVWLVSAAEASERQAWGPPQPAGAPGLLLLWDTRQSRAVAAWTHRLAQPHLRASANTLEIAKTPHGGVYYTIEKAALAEQLRLEAISTRRSAAEEVASLDETRFLALTKVTPLLRAIAAGDVTKVRGLLAGGASPNEGRDEWTPLWSAARLGRHDLVDLLMDAGAVSTSRGMGAWCDPLWPEEHAAELGHLQTLDRLLEPLPHEVRTRRLSVGLIRAVLARRPEMVRPLAERGADLHASAVARSPRGPTAARLYTPLTAAADVGDERCVSELLAVGAGADFRPPTTHARGVGWTTATPLLVASYFGDDAVATRLLAAGADPVGNRGYVTMGYVEASPLELALIQRHHAVAQRMLEVLAQRRNPGDPRLHLGQAALSRAIAEPRLLRGLVDAGLDPTAAFDDNRASPGRPGTSSRGTAFTVAAAAGDWGAMQRLIDLGVRLDTPVDGVRLGDLALIRAAERGHTEVVREMMAHGYDLDARDHEGMTALMRLVSSNPSIRRVDELLGLGPDLDARRPDGATAASLATDASILARLTAGGGSGEHAGAVPSPWLAAHLLRRAIRDGDAGRVSEVLASAPAIDFQSGAGAGETPLEVAIENDRVQIARLLIAADSGLDRQRSSYVADAAYYGRSEIVDALLEVPGQPDTHADVALGEAITNAREQGHEVLARRLEAIQGASRR